MKTSLGSVTVQKVGQSPEWVVYMKEKLEKSGHCQCTCQYKSQCGGFSLNRKNNLKTRAQGAEKALPGILGRAGAVVTMPFWHLSIRYQHYDLKTYLKKKEEGINAFRGYKSSNLQKVSFPFLVQYNSK